MNGIKTEIIYDQGEFNYAMTGRIWIYENQDGKLDKGDDCLILPGGYGQVLDATRKYYKVWVSQKPALPQKGGVLKPYANSWIDVSGGASLFYNLFEGDYGIDASVEVQFRKKFLYFRPLVGVDLLLYEAADNPLLVSGGFAYSRLLGRLRLDFAFAVCIGQRFSPNYTVSHTGTKIAIHASIPLFSFLRLELEGGVLTLKGEASDTVNGVIAGAAFVIQ